MYPVNTTKAGRHDELLNIFELSQLDKQRQQEQRRQQQEEQQEEEQQQQELDDAAAPTAPNAFAYNLVMQVHALRGEVRVPTL